ncbi:MAG: putative cytochrome c precursor [Gammaproteobacteria bacterium]|nr:putative cytochrome c precursor [Gammaproteobacteria bacterium]
MRLKRLLAMVGGALVALIAAMAVSYVSDQRAGEKTLMAPTPTAAVVARGAYLARLGDCAACHSVPARPAFSGGLRMRTPIGAIYTTNITPDVSNGIGRFTLTDFDRALRFGVAKGHTLYPAMPYTSYYNTTPADVAALYAYFKYAVPASSVPNRATDIVFALSMRWPLTFWRWLFAPKPSPFAAAPGMTNEVAKGAYFAEGLGHCGECHTPRGIFLQARAATGADGPTYLSGAVIENYFAPSLRSDGPGTLGEWSADEVTQFLLTGGNTRGIAFGSMTDVITHSTQYMTSEDALATAKYLKTLGFPGATPQPSFVYDATEHRALKNGDASKPGAMLYLNNCAACHRPDGMGYERVFPRLSGNPIVQARNPLSVVSIVLEGSRTPRTGASPAQFTMPGFAWRLSDQDVADVVNFVRTSWGNHASAATADAVRRTRSYAAPE